MSENSQGKTLGAHLLAGAVAGAAAAFAMSEFQQTWVRISRSRRKGRPRTDEEVMQEVVRRVVKAAGGPRLAKRNRERAGIVLHYGFGITAGALYAVLAQKNNLVTTGFGSAFGTLFFAVGDLLATRELKPLVNDSQVVSEIYEWLTHVVYGVTLEAGRRGADRLLSRAA